MLAIFSKKKISEDKLANVLVNSFLELSEKGFGDIADSSTRTHRSSDIPTFLRKMTGISY